MIAYIRGVVTRRSRDRKLEHFFSLCPDGSTVLDVGVSGMVNVKGHINHFLENYPRDPSSYTGLGIDDMTVVQTKFPLMHFVRYDGKIFPFEDEQFDWVFSNAVIEHVGNEAAQSLFINEMLRVAKSIYFTTPNMFFPIETHSSQLFRHWNRKSFNRWAERNNRSWLTNSRLRLLGLSDLRDLLEHSNAKRYKIFKNRLLGWPMTFSVVANS
jgi:ubiquinone/menaquinone biosynthesis C-methylase UbiE